MFAWYQEAEICYAYLSDVLSSTDDLDALHSEFRRSQWFTRGWTLQELLAPYSVDFFSQDWTWFGSKDILHELISDVTRIKDLWSYKTASVAQKMSWASIRTTTRIEDRAYSLLGLFGVHMPPIYGEGENAFIRLQLEILSKTDDDSIFAWERDVRHGHAGLLAPSPVNFLCSSDITKTTVDIDQPPHSMTSKGLCVQFTLIPSTHKDLSSVNGTNFLALLNCAEKRLDGTTGSSSVVALHLYRSEFDQTWCRSSNLKEFQIDPETRLKIANQSRRTLYVPQVSAPNLRPFEERIRVATPSFSEFGFALKKTWRWRTGAVWNHDTSRHKLYWFHETDGRTSIAFERASDAFAIVLGISQERLWIDIVVFENTHSAEYLTDSSPFNYSLERTSLPARRDRVSRPFLNGSINARIQDGKFKPGRIIEVTFDPAGKLRWPVHGGNDQTWTVEEFEAFMAHPPSFLNDQRFPHRQGHLELVEAYFGLKVDACLRGRED